MLVRSICSYISGQLYGFISDVSVTQYFHSASAVSVRRSTLVFLFATLLCQQSVCTYFVVCCFVTLFCFSWVSCVSCFMTIAFCREYNMLPLPASHIPYLGDWKRKTVEKCTTGKRENVHYGKPKFICLSASGLCVWVQFICMSSVLRSVSKHLKAALLSNPVVSDKDRKSLFARLVQPKPSHTTVVNV